MHLGRSLQPWGSPYLSHIVSSDLPDDGWNDTHELRIASAEIAGTVKLLEKEARGGGMAGGWTRDLGSYEKTGLLINLQRRQSFSQL